MAQINTSSIFQSSLERGNISWNYSLFTITKNSTLWKWHFRHINSRNVYSSNLLAWLCYFSFYAFSKHVMEFRTAAAFSIFIYLEFSFSATETNSIFNSIISKLGFCFTNSKLGTVLRSFYRPFFYDHCLFSQNKPMIEIS